LYNKTEWLLAAIVFLNAALFDGRSSGLLPNRSVAVEDGKITRVGEGALTIEGAEVVDVGGRTLMPGLIDLHAHPCLADVVAPRAVVLRTEIVALYAAKALERSLSCGFTTLRDAGGADAIYVQAIAMGLIKGPRLYPAGRFITMTGGHGDMRDPLDRGMATCCSRLQDRFATIADGPDAVRKAVREELRGGATHIKLFLSGGVLSPAGALGSIQFSEAEVLAAVEEAEAQDRYVMAHCHPDAAIRRAAELGVRSIEHCSFITAPTADLMVERGAYAVPTLAVARALGDDADRIGLPAASRSKLNGVFEAMLRSLEKLKQAGVKIGFGTDVCGEHHVRRGSEFRLRAEVLSNHDILVSATSVAAEVIKETGRLGVIAPGAHADIIVVEGNPLEDIGLLDRAGETLPVIMKGGVFSKRQL
jgi:imidazolonepropionase-like amidohydrolase